MTMLAVTRRPKQLGFLEGQKKELTDHPPNSPDLAPDDFHLFSSVNNKLRGQYSLSREKAVDAAEEAVKKSAGGGVQKKLMIGNPGRYTALPAGGHGLATS
ncbi:hypothetical protein EVAR_47289_1 [Eumeta japonica]|uniref:Uncharacterized protein n=1 Tax=Eumeta variegata TaxID=151549 RepID=A0A4C1Z0V5_EUMVA|nr:hypothetical protein EVAR_47289_1 [Eumeta japonica]